MYARVAPLDGYVDDIARTAPNTPWVYIPKTNANVQDGFQAITFGQLAASVNKMSRWIERTIGASKTRDTIAYIDRSNDLRYLITILAALKTGHQILLPSPRNNPDGQRSLIQATQCKTILHSAGMKPELLALLDEQTQFQTLEIPSLEDLMQGDAEHYPSLASDDPMEPAIIIHTSGSTGLPKPIPLRNGYLAFSYRLAMVAKDGPRKNMGSVFFTPSTSLCTLPWFHAMGLFMFLRSIYSNGPLLLPPVGHAPNAELNLQMLKIGKPDLGFFPPSILEDLIEMPDGLAELAKLKFVLFAGAPLAQHAGDKICKVTKIQTIIGSTEAALLDSYVNEDPADWNYFEWCPWSGVAMEQSGELHEAVLKPLNNGLQGAFYSFPGIEEWRTKDLYAEHPTKPGLWQYRGRSDDMIVLSNGEKFNPIAFEKFIEGHPLVKGALVVGQARFQAGLLLEPSKQVDAEQLIEEIWPLVEKANDMVAAHARVWKSKIAIAKPGKDFVRAPKGNIIRRRTNDLFQNEIEAIYSNEGFAEQLGNLDAKADGAAVKEFIRRAIHLAMPNVPQNVDESADIFSFGVDSLAVLGLASAINHAMPKVEGVRDNAIKSRTVYGNPSIKALASVVLDMINGQGEAGPTKTREELMAETVQKYTADLPAPVKYNPRQEKHAVILTGSSGSLGNYILQLLIESPMVAKIYCLNRSDSEDRQRKSFEERGVPADFRKVTFFTTSFDKEQFGLAPEQYKEMQNTVDVFIHNAWAVNFNMGLESFEDVHVAGTRRCIDFSATSVYHPHIVFISSIASTGNWLGSGHTGLIPEVYMDDDSLPLPQGYGESKHVAGRILAAAAEKSNIASTVVRVGQLAGPTAEKGLWNRQEWLPSIIASSKVMGKIPRTLGNQDAVDWVPVDAAAKVLVDLVRTRLGTQAEHKLDVFHLVNPSTVSWSKLYPAVQKYYAAEGVQVQDVEFQDWLAELKSLPMTQEQMTKVPGLKLIDFYEGLGAANGGLPGMATEHTADASITLKELGPVDEAMIVNWCKQWKF